MLVARNHQEKFNSQGEKTDGPSGPPNKERQGRRSPIQSQQVPKKERVRQHPGKKGGTR